MQLHWSFSSVWYVQPKHFPVILTSGTVLFNTALTGLSLDAQTPGFGQKLLKHPQRKKTQATWMRRKQKEQRVNTTGCSAGFMWLLQNLSNLKLHIDILTGSLHSSRRNPCKPDTGVQASLRQQKGIRFLLNCPDTRFLAIFGLYTFNLPRWLFKDAKLRPESHNAQTM